MQWRTLDQLAPRIIAHRGASGLRPEHTLEGYALALSQGADVIEPDLVPSSDGVLFARHENHLSLSSDIAARPAFAHRQRDGDWYSEDLLADELDSLRARQPMPARSLAFDGRFAIPRWVNILAWAAQAALTRGASVTLYPEIKHPTALAQRGVDPVPIFIESVRHLPPGVIVWTQCFELETLRRVFDATGLPCALLLDVADDWRYAIREHGTWLARLGVNKQLLRAEQNLVPCAHSAGLHVDAWTFRDDVIAAGFASIEQELVAAMHQGVDGLFCDFPETALTARSRLETTQ